MNNGSFRASNSTVRPRRTSAGHVVASHGSDSLKDKLMSILLGIAAMLAVAALILGWMWVESAREGGLSLYLPYTT